MVNPAPTTLDVAFSVIRDERSYQDRKWGGPQHDAGHNPSDWTGYITVYLAKYVHWDATPEERKEAITKVAALAVAALEAEIRGDNER